MTGNADTLVQRALRALHAGQLADGARLYRRALEGSHGEHVPYKRHAELLEGIRHAEAAAVVRQVAVRTGCDVSSGPWRIDGRSGR